MPHPLVRKISFTGSVAVGKQLASLAGLHMKRSTMELGGHAPVLIFDDCNLEHAVALLADRKIRNAGQACGAPTRFYVQDKVFEQFSELFTRRLQAIRVGAGTVPETEMGPLCHGRRLDAMKAFVADAKSSGADILLGGEQSGKEGNFFQPTVIANPSASSRIMTEEPFGPVATLLPFNTFDEVIERANSLPMACLPSCSPDRRILRRKRAASWKRARSTSITSASACRKSPSAVSRTAAMAAKAGRNPSMDI